METPEQPSRPLGPPFLPLASPAPPPWYPAAPAPWAPPPRRRRSRWLSVGLPVAAVLVLGGIVTAVVLAAGAVSRGIGPAEQAARGYAAALVDQLAAHYCDPRPTRFRIVDVVVTDVNGTTSAAVDVDFTTADGLTTTTRLPLVQDGSRWRPCP